MKHTRKYRMQYCK